MTTAAKATYQGALGEPGQHGYWSTGGQTSRQFSAKDMPSHTKLKYRQPGQSHQDDLKDKDLRKELEEKEAKYEMEKQKEREKAGGAPPIDLKRLEGVKPLMLKDKEEVRKSTQKYDDRDDEADELDDDNDDSDLDSSDDEDDEDDEEVLRLELEKIKKEREEVKRKKEEEERAEAARKRDEEVTAAAMKGNPLLAPQSAQIKRKWNDDVVFKNQSRGEVEKKKRFINDTVRNDFHRSFLKRYMR